jgi:hypothetical protein
MIDEILQLLDLFHFSPSSLSSSLYPILSLILSPFSLLLSLSLSTYHLHNLKIKNLFSLSYTFLTSQLWRMTKWWLHNFGPFLLQAPNPVPGGCNMITWIPPCYPPALAWFECLVLELWMHFLANSSAGNWMIPDSKHDQLLRKTLP